MECDGLFHGNGIKASHREHLPPVDVYKRQGIGMDIGGGYDNSTLQPVFSVIAKNANQEQKEQFLQVIRETLQAPVSYTHLDVYKRQ